MTGALAAASEGTPANKAATMYGVPKSTLKDRISGRVVHGHNPGPCPYLDPDEEKKSAECGYGKTRREVAKTSPLSNYLSPMTPTAPRIKTGKARVLTSSECLAFLEEKERKKKAEVEEKERRKQDREAKRKQKEEEKRQKAQEKAKKAEESVKKAEEKARMATARATSKKAATTKVATTRATKRKTETSAPSAKRAKSADEQIDTIDVPYALEHTKMTSLWAVVKTGFSVHVENGSMRCVWKIVQLTVTEIQDFAQAVLNNICDNALYILSIIISLLLRVRDTVYKHVVQCIELYV